MTEEQLRLEAGRLSELLAATAPESYEYAQLLAACEEITGRLDLYRAQTDASRK
jgi:hypothetical protein